jgi:hypothetical protein
MYEVTAKRIVERQKQVEKIINYVDTIVRERGVILYEKVESCYTHTKAELSDFFDFTFYRESGYTMFGGDNIKIWYKGSLVFDVEWWDIKECNVRYSDFSPEWQKKLRHLIANKQRIATRLARQKKHQQARAEREFERAQVKDKLLQEAARLKL